MLKTVRLLLIAGVVALGCAGDEATGPDGNGGHATVAGARIFDAADTDVTSALQLAAGGTTRLRVRFTDAQGVLVSGLEEGHDAALVFEPAGFATGRPRARSAPGRRRAALRAQTSAAGRAAPGRLARRAGQRGGKSEQCPKR